MGKDFRNVVTNDRRILRADRQYDDETANLIMFDDKPDNVNARQGKVHSVSQYRAGPTFEDILDVIRNTPGMMEYVELEKARHKKVDFIKTLRGFYEVDIALREDGYDREHQLKDNEVETVMLKEINE